MRLFIAIDCNELNSYFSRLQQESVPEDARPLDTFHLTLVFLGEIPESRLNKFMSSLDNLSAKSFAIAFDHVGMFSIKRKADIFWVGVKEKDDVSILQRQIVRQLKPFNVKDQKRFIPHVTIARRKRSRNTVSVHAKRQPVEKRSKKVDSFKLIQSTLTPEGPIYMTIKEFRLI